MTSKIPLDSYSILFRENEIWMLRRIPWHAQQRTCTHFFLMDKLESWMINPKYLLLISYDINSYTYLIYRWFNENYKYVVSNQKMLIVLMSVLLYTLSLVPVRSWFVRMSHMPKKTSSREWVWWAPVCTVHQVPQRHSHKQAQTDIRTEHRELAWAEWSGHRHAAVHGWGTVHGTDGADLLAWIDSGDTRMRLAVPRNSAVVVRPGYAPYGALRRPLNWWWRRARASIERVGH